MNSKKTTKELVIVTRTHLESGNTTFKNEFTDFWGFISDKTLINFYDHPDLSSYKNHFLTTQSISNTGFKLLLINGYKCWRDTHEWKRFYHKIKTLIDEEDFFKKGHETEGLFLYHFSKEHTFFEKFESDYSHIETRKYSSTDDNYEDVYLELALSVKQLVDEKKQVPVKHIKDSLNKLWTGKNFDSELETKLQILHACLTPTTAKKFIDMINLKNQMHNIKIGSQSVVDYIENSFVNSSKNDPFDVSYMKSLVILRDRLLQ